MLQYGKIANVRLKNGKSEIVITSEDTKLYEYVTGKHVKDVLLDFGEYKECRRKADIALGLSDVLA